MDSTLKRRLLSLQSSTYVKMIPLQKNAGFFFFFKHPSTAVARRASSKWLNSLRSYITNGAATHTSNATVVAAAACTGSGARSTPFLWQSKTPVSQQPSLHPSAVLRVVRLALSAALHEARRRRRLTCRQRGLHGRLLAQVIARHLVPVVVAPFSKEAGGVRHAPRSPSRHTAAFLGSNDGLRLPLLQLPFSRPTLCEPTQRWVICVKRSAITARRRTHYSRGEQQQVIFCTK